MMQEISLCGGRTTVGVVRIGETVRRPTGTHSEFVDGLLRHLETSGFDGVPRPLGTDEQGRDVFSYIEGQVPNELGWFDDNVLVAAANLIRRFHDATAPLVDTAAARSAQFDTICHNDLSPCNFVFRNDLPIGLIDFDTAAPGSRRYDMGYAAWLWLDVGDPDIAADEQRRRFKLFVEAYGEMLSANDIVTGMMTRQRIAVANFRKNGSEVGVRWATGCLDWTSAHMSMPES